MLLITMAYGNRQVLQQKSLIALILVPLKWFYVCQLKTFFPFMKVLWHFPIQTKEILMPLQHIIIWLPLLWEVISGFQLVTSKRICAGWLILAAQNYFPRSSKGWFLIVCLTKARNWRIGQLQGISLKCVYLQTVNHSHHTFYINKMSQFGDSPLQIYIIFWHREWRSILFTIPLGYLTFLIYVKSLSLVTQS